MSADVPLRIVRPRRAQVAIGRAVRGPTWRDMIKATHAALGRGAQLVAATGPGTEALSAGTAHLYAFRTQPTYQAHCRLWIINAHGNGESGTIQVVAPEGGAFPADRHISGERAIATPVYYLEKLSSQSDSETEITIEITPASGGSGAVIDSIACVEVPRLKLSTSGSDLGTDLRRAQPAQPIYADDAGTDIGLNRLADALATYGAIGRRVSHFPWAVPYKVGGTESTSFAKSTTASSGSPDNFFPIAVPLLGRPGELVPGTAGSPSTVDLKAAVLAHAPEGTDGTLRIAMTSGDSVDITITGDGTYNWHTGTISVNAEDQSTADGLRGGSWDDATITWWRDSGTDPIYAAGLDIFEPKS